jgi:FkbM family methyltransferase
MHTLARALLPKQIRAMLFKLRQILFDVYATKSYSQEGEDMILRRMFEGKTAGFYVDIGAHHPRRFSNTYYFYRRGWHGINVEPNPDAIASFKSLRKRDINLQCGVGLVEQSLTYYKFDEPALNTFDEVLTNERLAQTNYQLVDKIVVPVRRLERLFDEVLPHGQRIDYMTVDVEGFDLQVLQSNNWSKYRPVIVLAEALSTMMEDFQSNEIVMYMASQGYQCFGKTYNTWFFTDNRTPAA